MEMKSYRELKVWQLGMELAREVYQLSQQFPQHEVYGLTVQTRRAAVSIPANLAEGHARESPKEFLHYVSIVRGSLAELETLLMLAESLRYCKHGQLVQLLRVLRCEMCAPCAHLRNSKSEARNPKEIPNSNDQNPKRSGQRLARAVT